MKPDLRQSARKTSPAPGAAKNSKQETKSALNSKRNTKPAVKSKPDTKPAVKSRQETKPALKQHSQATFDVQAASKLISKADPEMSRLIKSVGPCLLELQPAQTVFESLLEAIVYQQLTARAAGTILGRVKDLYGGSSPTPAQILKTPDNRLRSAGLSRAKVLAARDLSEKIKNGTLPLITELSGMTDEEIVEAFTSVRGIGEWTVQMFLIFKLGRPDVMPCKDYGVRKGFARVFDLDELPSPTEVLSRSECWRPYRTVASWYLWRVPASDN
jgi:DNA-3-methyladenine glycosylase II